MPIVHGLVNEELWFLAGCEVNEGIRRVGEWRPDLERSLHAERQVMVIEEDQGRRTRVHEQPVIARALQRRGASFHDYLDVRGEKSGPGVHVLSNGG